MYLKKSAFIFHLCVAILSFFLFLSCSDNSAGPDAGSGGRGSASFTVTGAVTGQNSGIAEFYSFGAFGVYTWTIELYNNAPQTFEITFTKVGTSPISRPAPGTYNLRTGLLDTGFTAVYGNISGRDVTEYTPIFSDLCPAASGDGGTLTIESSSEDRIKGTFEFVGSDFDFNESGTCIVLGTVEVKGEFDARRIVLD